VLYLSSAAPKWGLWYNSTSFVSDLFEDTYIGLLVPEEEGTTIRRNVGDFATMRGVTSHKTLIFRNNAVMLLVSVRAECHCATSHLHSEGRDGVLRTVARC
jgi:hypothetical protein